MDSVKKILYFDMDGVIADFSGAINKLSPELDVSNYAKSSDMVYEICKQNPLIFHTLEPIPDTVPYVVNLMKYYEVYFLSTPMWEVPDSATGKILWLIDNFGEMAYKRLKLTWRKDLCIGSYLVDDRTANGAGEFTGEHIHIGTSAFPTMAEVHLYLMNKL